MRDIYKYYKNNILPFSFDLNLSFEEYDEIDENLEILEGYIQQNITSSLPPDVLRDIDITYDVNGSDEEEVYLTVTVG